MLPKKHMSGSKKSNKRKREEQFIESQRGALHKFFLTSSNVDVNEEQGQEPDHEQEPDHNLNAEAEVNGDARGDLALIAYIDVNADSRGRKICSLHLTLKIQMVMDKTTLFYLSMISEHGIILTIAKGIS